MARRISDGSVGRPGPLVGVVPSMSSMILDGRINVLLRYLGRSFFHIGYESYIVVVAVVHTTYSVMRSYMPLSPISDLQGDQDEMLLKWCFGR